MLIKQEIHMISYKRYGKYGYKEKAVLRARPFLMSEYDITIILLLQQ